MDTVLQVDALDLPIFEGDLLIDESGNTHRVEFTENSFIRQGLLRVRKATGRHLSPADTHSYVISRFTAKVDSNLIPATPKEVRDLYSKLIEPSRVGRRKELRERHILRRLG